MPIHKKKTHNARNKIIIFAIVAVLVVLMLISFAPAPNVTEIVLYP